MVLTRSQTRKLEEEGNRHDWLRGQGLEVQDDGERGVEHQQKQACSSNLHMNNEELMSTPCRVGVREHGKGYEDGMSVGAGVMKGSARKGVMSHPLIHNSEDRQQQQRWESNSASDTMNRTGAAMNTDGATMQHSSCTTITATTTKNNNLVKADDVLCEKNFTIPAVNASTIVPQGDDAVYTSSLEQEGAGRGAHMVPQKENHQPGHVRLPDGEEPKVVEISYPSSSELEPIEECDCDGFVKDCLEGLSSAEWHVVCASLTGVRRVVVHQAPALRACLGTIVEHVTKGVKSLRSALCKTAILTCQDLYAYMPRDMVKYTDVGGMERPAQSLLAQLLLKSVSNDKKFVVEEAGKCVQSMSKYVESYELCTLVLPYFKHKNPKVRGKVVWLLNSSIQQGLHRGGTRVNEKEHGGVTAKEEEEADVAVREQQYRQQQDIEQSDSLLLQQLGVDRLVDVCRLSVSDNTTEARDNGKALAKLLIDQVQKEPLSSWVAQQVKEEHMPCKEDEDDVQSTLHLPPPCLAYFNLILGRSKATLFLKSVL